MYQVPLFIWNDIAKTQILSNPIMQHRFTMTGPQLFQTLEAERNMMEKQGIPFEVRMAYQMLSPLLIEHQAISRYLWSTNQLSLRQLLPELPTAEKAIARAILHDRMAPQHADLLLKMLQVLEATQDNPTR